LLICKEEALSQISTDQRTLEAPTQSFLKSKICFQEIEEKTLLYEKAEEEMSKAWKVGRRRRIRR